MLINRFFFKDAVFHLYSDASVITLYEEVENSLFMMIILLSFLKK